MTISNLMSSRVKIEHEAIMKHKFKSGLFVAALFAMNALLPASAQPAFTNLYSFSANPGGNSDGANPQDGLILSGNTLYGTAVNGGTYGWGTVFAINTDGTGFTNLHSFNHNDGSTPFTSLVLSGNRLYGAASSGGTYTHGTVFAINTDGSSFTNLYDFTGGNDGGNLQGGLILSGNTLYGTAEQGGTNSVGTVFKVNTDGTEFAVLYTFSNSPDGAGPQAGLILAGNTLYGTTEGGGALGPEGFNSEGTVFAINTDGSGYRILHNFTDLFGSGTSDGLQPYAGLILSGDTLYGTTRYGGTNSRGTVFAINTNGNDYAILYNFTKEDNNVNNSDGSSPTAGLISSGNTLYGTASAGGVYGQGTVFAINTDGTGFTNLFNFGTENSGNNPVAGVALSGATLYGTMPTGGDGTIFALSLVPSLGIVSAGNQVVLSWPMWAPNFGLQTTANLSAGSWSNITSGINIVSDSYVFTNVVNGPAAFFRLMQ